MNALGLPVNFKCPQGTVWDGLERLCMLLRRLAYPCRYFDLIPMFASPVPEIIVCFGYRLSSWNQPFLSHYFLE